MAKDLFGGVDFATTGNGNKNCCGLQVFGVAVLRSVQQISTE
jgi:hypothetical protein